MSLPAIPETNEDAIAAYCHPEKDYSITKQKGGYQQIHGSQMVLSKFLLPWHYNKAKILSNVSPLYNFLTKEKVYYPEES